MSSRAAWKVPHSPRPLVRQRLRLRGAVPPANVGFFLRYLYYLLVDPSKYIHTNVVARAGVIAASFRGEFARVYRGRWWRTFFVTRWHVGFKFGEFSKTRQRAVFRSKVLKKKKKVSPRAQFLRQLQIDRVRYLKSGLARKQRVPSLARSAIY